jgi:hypothetical protein
MIRDLVEASEEFAGKHGIGEIALEPTVQTLGSVDMDLHQGPVLATVSILTSYLSYGRRNRYAVRA